MIVSAPRSPRRLFASLASFILLLLLTSCMTYTSMNGMRTLRTFKRQLRKEYHCITKIKTRMGQDYHADIIVMVRRASTEEMDAIVAECQDFLSSDEFLEELDEDFPPREERGDPTWWPSLSFRLLDITNSSPNDLTCSYYYGEAYHYVGDNYSRKNYPNYLDQPTEDYQIWHDLTYWYRP